MTEQCAESEALKAQLLELQTKFGILSVIRNDAKLLKAALLELRDGILNQSNIFFQNFVAEYRTMTEKLVEVINFVLH